jgi:hypothetical protein
LTSFHRCRGSFTKPKQGHRQQQLVVDPQSSSYPTQLNVTMSGKAATSGGKGKGKGGRGEKKQSTSSSSKAGLQFPVGRIARYLRNGKVRACVCVCVAKGRTAERFGLVLGETWGAMTARGRRRNIPAITANNLINNNIKIRLSFFLTALLPCFLVG